MREDSPTRQRKSKTQKMTGLRIQQRRVTRNVECRQPAQSRGLLLVSWGSGERFRVLCGLAKWYEEHTGELRGV